MACLLFLHAYGLSCQAIYEDDEMAGGMGPPPSAKGSNEIKMPFRPQFEKESDVKK